jgi:hypothetical protein
MELSSTSLFVLANFGHESALHLHVISSDLCGVGLTQLKYYNGFNPDLGFFLPIDEVLEWCEPRNPIYRQVSVSNLSCRGAASTYAKLDPEESTSTGKTILYTISTC